MEKDGLRTAIIVSALTFGLGHIVNLFNGSGRDPVSSIVQIVFAVLVGFVLVLIFYHGKSLIPCILFHSANNAFKVFSAEGNLNPQVEMVLNLVLIFVVLGGYSLYLVRAFSKNAEYAKTDIRKPRRRGRTGTTDNPEGATIKIIHQTGTPIEFLSDFLYRKGFQHETVYVSWVNLYKTVS